MSKDLMSSGRILHMNEKSNGQVARRPADINFYSVKQLSKNPKSLYVHGNTCYEIMDLLVFLKPIKVPRTKEHCKRVPFPLKDVTLPVTSFLVFG